MACRALLLDLDRTLVDLQSFTDYAAALDDLVTLLGDGSAGPVPETDWDAPTQQCMAAVVGLVGDPRWTEASRVVAVHERAAIPASQAMPTLADSAAAWQGTPAAVVTLLPSDVAAEVLAAHGISVPVIVGRSADLRTKPYGDSLRAACDRLGVTPGEAVMIGDSSWDLSAAVDAGVAFIGVPASPGTFPADVPEVPDLLSAVRLALGPGPGEGIEAG